MKLVAIILFIAMYVGLIALPKRKTIIALAVAVIFMILGILSGYFPLRKLSGSSTGMFC